MVTSRRYLLADTHFRHVHNGQEGRLEAQNSFLAAQDELFAALAVVELTAPRATSGIAQHLVSVLRTRNEESSDLEIEEWDNHYEEIEVALTEAMRRDLQ